MTHPTSRRRPVAVLLATTMAVAGCTSTTQDPRSPASPANSLRPLPQNTESLTLDPADFSTTIDNPYWPMAPGASWTFRESDTTGTQQKVVVTVTDQTKRIANGVTARVVRDVVTEDGVPVEVTDDWYAQDRDGNIWYLGEATTEYENGKPVNTDGSFEAGVDGAQAGIAIPAGPAPGMTYRQEYYAGQAEDRAGVITVGQEQVQVPFGHFTKDILMTRDLVPLEPTVQELKFYAPGVGPLLSIHLDGNGGRAELVAHAPGNPDRALHRRAPDGSRKPTRGTDSYRLAHSRALHDNQRLDAAGRS